MKLPEPFANADRIVLWLLLLAPFMSAQQEKRAGQLTLPEREALAKPLLVHAESISVGIDDPATRAILLYRTAGAWLPLEPSHAVTLYREAFASARKAPALRPELEDAILNDLIPLSPRDVLDLLPDAETTTQTRIYSAVINFELTQGDYSAATQAFDRAVAGSILPRRAVTHLIASLPQGASADRARIFAAIVRYYQAHPDPNPFQWNLAELIVRFHAQLPRELVVQAIETVLHEAERHPGGQTAASFGNNSVGFLSGYDAQLFAVAPILGMLEPSRAVSLLAQHSEAAANLKQYPEGLRSLNPEAFGPFQDTLGVNRGKPIGLQLYNTVELAQNLSALDVGLEFTIPRNLNILGVTGSVAFFPNPNDPEASILEHPAGVCPRDVTHRIELARTIPITRRVPTLCSGPNGKWCSYEDTYPRVYLIQTIAERCTYYADPLAANAALHEQIEVLDQMPAARRLDYLATAADLYLRLGNRDAAADVIQRGFSSARAIYEQEASSKLPKGVWASAEAYRRMIALGVNVSVDSTSKEIDKIPSADLRELEKVMAARALLGVPVRRYIVASLNGSLSTGDVEVTYDQL